MAKVAAIVLAAGLSTRMGGEKKLFLPYKKRTIIGEVLYQLSESSVDEIIVVAGTLSMVSLTAICSGNARLKLVNNPDYALGITTSIQAGVRNCSDDISGYMISLGDMPKIVAKTYDAILTDFRKDLESNPSTIAVPYFEGKKGNPVVFSKFYKELILGHKNMEGCRSIIKDYQDEVNAVVLNTDEVLFDVDTPSDYNKLMH